MFEMQKAAVTEHQRKFTKVLQPRKVVRAQNAKINANTVFSHTNMHVHKAKTEIPRDVRN